VTLLGPSAGGVPTVDSLVIGSEAFILKPYLSTLDSKHHRLVSFIGGLAEQYCFYSIKAALASLSKVPPPSQEQDAIILRTSMMQSLSWHQLLALSYQQNDDQGLPNDVERTWSAEALQSATSERAVKKGFTRKALSQLLQEAGMTSLPSTRKERIYKAIKRDQKEDRMKGLPTAAELRQYDRSENVKAKRPFKNVNIKKALRWQDLPISDSSDTRWQNRKELAGIQDEIHLAARQLHLTGMRVDALGPTAEIFDLGKMALLLECVNNHLCGSLESH
jgi:hypothetical protein